MSLSRRCSRTACGGSAIATLTYVYSDQTAVLGPLATYAEPHTYDLCAAHAERLTAPRGWDVVRLASEFVDPAPDPGRPGRARRRRPRGGTPPSADSSRRPPRKEPGAVEVGRRGHLRILRGQLTPARARHAARLGSTP